jgi:uncharacterized metal-binding protein
MRPDCPGQWRKPDHRRQPDSSVRHRALAFLAGCPDGCAETLLLVNGFTVELMVELVRDGLASASPERVVSGSEMIEVARVRITEAGRRVLEAATKA